IDRASGRRHAFRQVPGEPGDLQSGTGVEDDDVALGPLLAVDHAPRDLAVMRRIAASEVLRFDPTDADLRRVEMGLPDGSVLDVVDGGEVGRRELVRAVDPTEAHRAG